MFFGRDFYFNIQMCHLEPVMTQENLANTFQFYFLLCNLSKGPIIWIAHCMDVLNTCEFLVPTNGVTSISEFQAMKALLKCRLLILPEVIIWPIITIANYY